MGSLLHLLHTHFPTLPRGHRTLLESRPIVGIEPMGNGEYYYFVMKGILKRVVERDPKIPKLLLSFNVDGLPVFKSSGTECWPIRCLVEGTMLPPFVLLWSW